MSFLYPILRYAVVELKENMKHLIQGEEDTSEKVQLLIDKNIELLIALNKYKINTINEFTIARAEWFLNVKASFANGAEPNKIDLLRHQQLRVKMKEKQGLLIQILKVDFLKVALYFELLKAKSLCNDFKKPKRRLSRSC